MDDVLLLIEAIWLFIKGNAAALSAVAAIIGVMALFLRRGKAAPATKVEVHVSNEQAKEPALPNTRHQIGSATAGFVGRGAVLDEIAAALAGGGAAIMASLEGMGGVGKTAVARVAARRLIDAGRFKDAQLFIDLQGFTPGVKPKAPAEALAELLRPLVPPDADLPDDVEALGQLWRGATEGLDMLLFLHNESDEAQVRGLLTGHTECVTIITSRNRLALGEFTPIDLDVMAPGEAAELALHHANRRDAARLTLGQAENLAGLCGRLPLAIEIAANTLDAASGWNADAFLTALAKGTETFNMLEGAERSLKATLAASLETLDGETLERWQALAVFEGGFDAAAAGELWQVGEPQPTLAELQTRSLLTFDADAGRHHLHDLLRALALERLSGDASRERDARHAAIYLSVLEVANELYNQGHDAVAQGLGLLDRELANIRAGQRWTAADGEQDAAALAMRYPNFAYLWLRLSPIEVVGWLKAALAAAVRLGDRATEAIVRGNLGILYRRRGDLDAAEDIFWKSLAIDEELGRREGMANQYTNLGNLYLTRGDLDAAEDMYRKGLAIDEELGRRESMASHYGNLGSLYSERGDLDAAEDMYRKSLAIDEELGRREGMANQYTNFGILYRTRADLDAAEAMYNKSLALFRELRAEDRIAQVEELLRTLRQ